MKCIKCTARFHSNCLYQWMELSELPLEQACPARCFEETNGGGGSATTGESITQIPVDELKDALANLESTAGGAQCGGWLWCEGGMWWGGGWLWCEGSR